MNKTTAFFTGPFDQRGAALITSLLMLLVLTILALTAMETTVMEEKMSSNSRQKQIAQQAAESALRAGELFLANNINTLPDIAQNFNGAGGLYDSTQPGSGAALNWDPSDAGNWSAGNSVADTRLNSFSNNPAAVPGPPRFVIEYLGTSELPPLNFKTPSVGRHSFRVTAIGWGRDTRAKVVLSSTVKL